MKKIFLTIAAAALFSVSVFAADGGKKATENTVNISYSVQQAFSADFAEATNVIWSADKNCQKADFVIDGVKNLLLQIVCINKLRLIGFFFVTYNVKVTLNLHK